MRPHVNSRERMAFLRQFLTVSPIDNVHFRMVSDVVTEV